MTAGEIMNAIMKLLPDHPLDEEHWHGFWANKYDDELMCPNKKSAEAIANLFEDMGIDIMHTHSYPNEDYPNEDYANEDCKGFYSTYIDG